MTDVVSRYVTALADKDTEALLGIFASEVSFRGMTPGRFWDVNSPAEIVENVLYQWFEPDDIVEAVEHVEVGKLVDRQRVVYRFRVRTANKVYRVEQCAYFDLDDDGRVSRMNVICSGFRPLADATQPEAA
jgi:ketosteroid isomerase-like protein